MTLVIKKNKFWNQKINKDLRNQNSVVLETSQSGHTQRIAKIESKRDRADFRIVWRRSHYKTPGDKEVRDEQRLS